jgi:hypothetical protein
LRHARLALAALLFLGCASAQRGKKPTAEEAWNTAFAAAQVAADSGKYELADKTLAEFISAHKTDPRATEAVFWRGVYKVDPNNKSGSLSAGISSLDAFLNSDSTSWYVPIARVLRRTAALAQSLTLAASVQAQTTTVVPVPVDKDAMKSRDEEIASLRDQLTKVKAELDRIKKRLANPKA